MTSIKLLAAGLLLVASTAASKSEAQGINTYNINMNHAQFQGQNRLIRIKQRLNQAYPGINFNNADLVEVRLFAKSRAGGGQVELLVRNSSRDRAIVPQSAGRFASNLPRTYHQIRLNPNGVVRGAWQLRLDGNIKVQRIAVRVRGADVTPTPPPAPTEPYVNLGTGDTTLFLPLVQVFNVNQTGVRALRIEARDNLMVIKSVDVRFNDGTQTRLTGFEGELFAGQFREVQLNNRHIRRITVAASSVVPFGATASYRILARIR